MDLSTYLDPDIIASIQTGGYILMFGLMILEWPFVTFAGAFLASLWIFDIWIVFLLGWLGDILGDLLFYSIGKYGIHIFQKKTTIDTAKEKSFIHRLDTLIHTNLALAIMIIKFTPYAPPIGLTYIGKIGVSLRRYISTSILLCIPIPLISTLIGFYLGSINTLVQQYSWIELYISIAWIFLIIIWAISIFFFLKKKSEKELQKESISSKRNEKNTKTDKEPHE
jgi:membrane protein DedA with SNARE-associated domain